MASNNAREANSSLLSSRSTFSNPPNARRLMSSLRRLGYESYQAIMDLIDNSLDANARIVSVSVGKSGDDISITIADDGIGMDELTLKEAIRLGSETPHTDADLGSFGLGLVTASISQCRRLEVLSKSEDLNTIAAGFDLDDIDDENDFVAWFDQTPGFDVPGSSGTIVKLTKIDHLSNRDVTTFANTLRKKVGQTFRKFIKSGVVIEINGRKAEAFDPLMLTLQDTNVVLHTDVQVEQGKSFSIKVVELPDLGGTANKEAGITSNNAGFYLLRNNREISAAVNFDLFARHAEVAHFRAEIEFDGSLDDLFRVDVTKSRIDHVNQALIDRIKEVSLHLLRQSTRNKRRRADADRGTVDHSIAEGLIARKAKLLPKPDRMVEKRERRGGKGTHPHSNGDRNRVPRHQEFKTPSGMKVIFEEASFGETPYYSVKQENATIIITYNRDHPLWRELLEHAEDAKVIALLDYMTFSLAMTEIMTGEGFAGVRSQMNTTLVSLLS